MLTTTAITGQIESNYDEITDSFDAMNLKSELLRGMAIYMQSLSIDTEEGQVSMLMVSNVRRQFSLVRLCQSLKVCT